MSLLVASDHRPPCPHPFLQNQCELMLIISWLSKKPSQLVSPIVISKSHPGPPVRPSRCGAANHHSLWTPDHRVSAQFQAITRPSYGDTVFFSRFPSDQRPQLALDKSHTRLPLLRVCDRPMGKVDMQNRILRPRASAPQVRDRREDCPIQAGSSQPSPGRSDGART